MKKKAMALVLALVMVLSLLPVTAMADDSAVTIGNHGYPWMRYEGSSLSQYLNLDITGEATSYLWMSADEKDGTYSAVSGEVSTNFELKCDYVSGKWVKCVVNGTVESKPVYIINKRVGNRSIFSITNGTVGYTLTGSSFDVYAKFGDTWKSTSNGGHEDTWPLFAVRSANPNENASPSTSQLASFRGYFLDHDPYTVMMEATIAEGTGNHFSFGTDLGFGDKAMTNIIKNNDGDVTGIQLIQAKNKIFANENSPSIVISTPTPDKWWLGSGMSKIKPFTQGTSDESFGSSAAGMTFSWLNLPANTVIPFSASVGTVEQTGADLGDPVPSYNITLDRTNCTASNFGLETYDEEWNYLDYIYENNATTVIPTDGLVQLYAKAEFYVTAAGATVGELTEDSYGWYYREITNFTKDTTIVVSDEPIAGPTYTIKLDRTNYADGYLELYAYDKDNHNVGDPISENNATVSMPEDGFVRVFAGKEFTVTAEGATVSDMLEAGEEGYYYEITDFDGDTTVVVSEKVGPTYEITLDGSDFSGWYLLLNAYDNAGGRVGWIDEDGASISMPQDGFVEVLTSHECIVTAEGATVVALPHAEEAEVYGYKITNFTKDTTVVVSDIPDIIVDTIDLTVDWDKVPELVVGKPGPAFRPSNPDGGDYLVVNCDGVSEYFYGWLRERTEEEGVSGTKWIGLGPDDVIANDVEYALGVEFPLDEGYAFADTVTVKINAGLVATIDYVFEGNPEFNEPTMMGITIALGTLEDIEDAKDDSQEHSHEMTKTPAKDATCTADGNIEYYTCSGCEKFFADEDGKTELAADKLVVKSEGHKMTKTAAKAPTCTADGNVAYYTCSVCKKTFADEKGEKELKAEELVVKSEGHKMTKTPAKAATCTADGNVAYYTCSVCKKHFADAEGKTELAADKLAVKSEGHKIEKIAGKAPTYIADGNKEYYHCNVCDTAFADAEGKTELTASEIKGLVIPQLILVAENKAEVSEGAVDKALSESKKDGDVTLDLTHKDVIGEENVGAVTKVELPVAALETMVEEEKALTLVKEDATVTLDAKALETIVEQAEGNTVTLVVKNVEATTLKPAQQAAMESKKVAATISAELICDQTGEKIATKDDKGFGGGAVTVAIPVPEELPAGIKASDLKVYYVADDGTVEHLSSKLEGDKIVFTLKHFSEYVIAADAPADPITPPTGDNSAVAMYIMLAVISAAAIVLLIAYEKKAKARYF